MFDGLCAENLTKDYMRELIFACESIFFRDEAFPVDCARLNTDLDTYELAYDDDVRRPYLNLILFMEEVLHEKHLSSFRCTSSLYHLESFFLSPEFYRELLLSKKIETFCEIYEDFCEALQTEIDLFQANVNAECYASARVSYPAASLPEKYEEFLTAIEDIKCLTMRKRDFLRNIKLMPDGAER